MITIPVEIQIDDEPQEFKMDVLFMVSTHGIDVRSCFIEEIPKPSSAQQYAMQSQAEKYIEENESAIIQSWYDDYD